MASESSRNLGAPAGDRSASLRAGSMSGGQSPSDTQRASTAGHFGTRPVAPEQEAAKEWIRAHETLALLSAFAVGVFIGTWMRS